MNYRTGSLISLSVTLVLGLVFFALSFGLPMSEPGLVIGAGYYPRVLSAILIAASAVGIYTNYKKRENAAVELRLGNIKYLLLVLGLAVLMTAVWQLTHSFYPICTLVVLALLWVLNPEPASSGKLKKTLLVAAILLASIYALFSLLLQLSL